MKIVRNYRYIWMALILLADQASKYAVRSGLEVGETISLHNPLFQLTYVRNTGAAFNLFAGWSWLLMLVPLAAMLFAIWYMNRHLDKHPCLLLALILIIAGGAGNLIDRACRGYVTDMIDFVFWPAFPVFNLADISICCGCFFLIVYMFFFDQQTESEARK